MDQVTFNVTMDANLKGEFERACHKSGRNMTDVFDVLVRQFIRNPDVVFPNVSYADTVKSPVVTDEDLRRGREEIDAGFGIPVSGEELEALSKDPPDPDVLNELMRRRDEIHEKLVEWRKSRGYTDV